MIHVLGRDQPIPQSMTVHELIDLANQTIDKMGRGNSHRRVVWLLAMALADLTDRYGILERRLKELKDEAKQPSADQATT